MKDDKKKIKKKKLKFKIDIKNMGVNIDKNEYREIVLSNSNHPEKFWQKSNVTLIKSKSPVAASSYPN